MYSNLLASMSGSGELFTNFTGPNCPPFDKKIYAIIAAVTAASGFTSLLANWFIIFIIILFKKWKFLSQRLILYLAIAASMVSVTTIIERVDYDNQIGPFYSNFCVFSGFFGQVSSWMLLNAIVSIMIFLSLKIFSSKKPENFEVLLLLLIFISPLAFNWIPFIQSAYGKAGAWCWIRTQKHPQDKDACGPFMFGQILQLALWYVPLYAIIFVSIVVYVIILLKVYRAKKRWREKFDFEAERTREQMKKEVYLLIAYPLIFFIFNIIPLINRIDSLTNSEPNPTLWFITGIVYPLRGSAIAIAFTLDPETRKRLTVANFRAAFREFCRSKTISEYPVQHLEYSTELKEELLNKE